ncbi:hypothetical protein NM208_g13155 [Fusarium decemcellulare]|uniref:Uncharacterized protein n=1 Tax=Fusarium decemcellulare TaxID=57161 RepID=A0ACC1RNE2_9HYPO|nr:hypothetical protein NM208_g13155 [Fusarium decemcellulare]
MASTNHASQAPGGYSPASILGALLANSPESNMTLHELTSGHNVPSTQPSIDDTCLPWWTVCCGCSCKSAGHECNCAGEGCERGIVAQVKASRSGVGASVEMPYYGLEGMVAHNYDECLRQKISASVRDVFRRHNERYAVWLQANAARIPPGVSLDQLFQDLDSFTEKVLQAVHEAIGQMINLCVMTFFNYIDLDLAVRTKTVRRLGFPL